MTKPKTIEILHTFNRWRRGADIEHPSPKLIGEAIDAAIKHLKEAVKAGKAAKAKAKARKA